MKKSTKIALTVLVSVVGLSLVAYAAVLITAFAGVKETTSSYDLDGLKEANIKLVESKINIVKTTSKPKIEFTETNKVYHKVTFKDGILDVKRHSSFHPFEFFVPNYTFPLEMTLYLNSDVLNSINIKNVSGLIDIDYLNAKDIKIESVSGMTDISNVNSSNLKMYSVSGKIIGNNIKNTSNINIETVSGAIEFKDTESVTLNLKSVSGKIDMELLTTKKFETKSVSGKITTPNSDESKGLCKAETVSGAINITLKP